MAILKIYNEITTEEDKQFLKWCMGMDGVCFKDIDEFLSGMDAKDNTVDIRLHCDGGSVSEGWAIYDKLRASGKEISATVEGKCASMATIIMMAAPKERRKAYKSANICVHNPWVPCYCLDEQLTAEDLRKTADSLQKEQDKMLDLYVERCGCDKDEIQALMNEDKYIDTDRAKELGIISEIIAPASAKKGSNNNFKSMAKTGNVEVKQSILDKLLGKLGYSKVEDVALGMDLSTADGGTLTVEREEGEPQVGDVASPDGEHVMPDGSTIVVVDGAITEIKPAASGEDGDGDGGDEKDKKIAELEQKVSDLEAENADLKEKLDESKAQAKTTSDLAILNAVKMAGGEKWLAKNCSSFKMKGRSVSGVNAHRGSEGNQEETPMEREIRERREGTYNKKK